MLCSRLLSPLLALLTSRISTVLNQFVSTPIVTYSLVFPVYQYFGAPAWDTPLPAWHVVFLGFVAAKGFNEFVFYYSHRALHAAWICEFRVEARANLKRKRRRHSQRPLSHTPVAPFLPARVEQTRTFTSSTT